MADNVYNVVCTTFITKVCSSRNKTCYRWENYCFRYISPVQQYQYKDSFTRNLKCAEILKEVSVEKTCGRKRSLNYVCVEVFEKTSALNVKVNSVWTWQNSLHKQFWTDIKENWRKKWKNLPSSGVVLLFSGVHKTLLMT